MTTKLLLKFLKSTGVILAILSIVYTSIQIITYFNHNQNKLEASFVYYDLHEFSYTLGRFPYVNDYKERISILNKYLKTPIRITKYYVDDTPATKKIEAIREVFFRGISEEVLQKDFIYLIKIQNTSETEIKDIKIDLTESFANEQYSYIIHKFQAERGFRETDSIKTAKNTDKVILLGTLLPQEIKTVVTYGLQKYSLNYPRVIYPDGYINAYGCTLLSHSNKFDEWLTNFVSSSTYIQIFIGLLTLLGFIYFFKLSFKIARYFFKI